MCTCCAVNRIERDVLVREPGHDDLEAAVAAAIGVERSTLDAYRRVVDLVHDHADTAPEPQTAYDVQPDLTGALALLRRVQALAAALTSGAPGNEELARVGARILGATIQLAQQLESLGQARR